MAQSNQNFFQQENRGSPGAGSGTARSLVGPWQEGQGGGFGVASIPLIQKKDCPIYVT
jgi:hypothetical protein